MLFNVGDRGPAKTDGHQPIDLTKSHGYITLPPLGEPRRPAEPLPRLEFPRRESWPFSNPSPFLASRGSSRSRADVLPSLLTVPALERVGEHQVESDSPDSVDGASSANFSPRQRNPSLTSVESDVSLSSPTAGPTALPMIRCSSGRIVKGYDKVQHKVKERRRRGNIAKEMHYLRTIVPGCVPGRAGGPKETSKHECLQKTVAYIMGLQKEVQERDQEASELRRLLALTGHQGNKNYAELVDEPRQQSSTQLGEALGKLLAGRTDQEALTIQHLYEASGHGAFPGGAGDESARPRPYDPCHPPCAD